MPADKCKELQAIAWRPPPFEQVKYTLSTNEEGHRVFLYEMRRRTGQAELLSKTVVFGGASAPREHTMASRAQQARHPIASCSACVHCLPHLHPHSSS